VTAQTARPGAWADALTPRQAVTLDARLTEAYLAGRKVVNELSRQIRYAASKETRRLLFVRREGHNRLLADLYDLHLDLMDRRS